MKGLVHYNYKDLFRAFRFALSFKKLIVLYPLSVLPLLTLIYSSKISVFSIDLFDIIVVLIFIIYYIFSKLLISKLTYEQMKGDLFYEMRKAFWFSIRNIPKYIGFLLLILLSLAITFIFFYAFVLISKLGMVFLYISFPFILFFTILMFYILIGFVMSESVGISAIATQEYDGFDVFFESFSMFNSQIYRFLGYKIISIICAIVGGVIMLLFLFLVIQFIDFFLKLKSAINILYLLTYLIAVSYSFSILFVSDLISYLILVYKRDKFDLSKLEPEIYSQRT